jgi:uncharacterized RDD family membrane protein YckC
MPFCSYCGSEISAQAANCPNCGHPNEARGQGPGSSASVQVGVYAGFWRRFLALLLDSLIVGFVAGLFFRPEIGLEDDAFRNYNYGPNGLITFLYHWLMLTFNKGQTIGKLALGIRVTRPDGSRLDIGRAAARQGMAIVSGLAIGLGFLWAAWDPQKRTWHDMVADTRAHRVPGR